MLRDGQSGIFMIAGIVFGLVFSYIALWLLWQCWPAVGKIGGAVKRIALWIINWNFPSYEPRPQSASRPYDDVVIFDPESAAQATKVNEGDFRGVRGRLMNTYDWDVDRVDAAEREYRRFLLLSGKHRGISIVPWDLDLDLFWQEHILDTRDYAEFCARVFGFFLHRNPNLTSESSEWLDKINNARNLYRREFGYATWAGDSPVVGNDNSAGEFFPSEEAIQEVEEIPEEKGGK